MEPTVVAIIVVAAVIAVAIAGLVIARRRRRAHLRDRFGPEYDRTLERSDSTRAAERDLAEREEFHDQLDLRELSAAERERYREQWDAVQAAFVDRPEGAVRDADHLVGAVMRDRGYPVDDFEQQADLISVDHPDVVSHYRTAHRIAVRDNTSDVSTEDRREAFIHFRALFDQLLGVDAEQHHHV